MKNFFAALAAIFTALLVIDSGVRFFSKEAKKYVRNDSFQIEDTRI